MIFCPLLVKVLKGNNFLPHLIREGTYWDEISFTNKGFTKYLNGRFDRSHGSSVLWMVLL
jgi:hypothetical protein